MLPNWALLALAGMLGQVLRVLLGIKKAIEADVKLDPDRIFYSLIYAAFWGAMIGTFSQDWRLAFTAGLGATDVTESLISLVQSKAVKKNNK